MAAISKFKQIEQEHKKPMREILIEMIDRHGSLNAVADELGVSQGTVSQWLIRCGLVVKTILVDAQESA